MHIKRHHNVNDTVDRHLLVLATAGDVFTRHTLVWQATKFAFCPVSFGYSYLCDGGTDRRGILRDGT